MNISLREVLDLLNYCPYKVNRSDIPFPLTFTPPEDEILVNCGNRWWSGTLPYWNPIPVKLCIPHCADLEDPENVTAILYRGGDNNRKFSIRLAFIFTSIHYLKWISTKLLENVFTDYFDKCMSFWFNFDRNLKSMNQTMIMSSQAHVLLSSYGWKPDFNILPGAIMISGLYLNHTDFSIINFVSPPTNLIEYKHNIKSKFPPKEPHQICQCNTLFKLKPSMGYS